MTNRQKEARTHGAGIVIGPTGHEGPITPHPSRGKQKGASMRERYLMVPLAGLAITAGALLSAGITASPAPAAAPAVISSGGS
jgi:hypothetical protein